MRIGLVAICKNNQDIILRMLQSAAPRCDEIHLTDTGSTDQTVEIAKAYLDTLGKPYIVARFVETPFHFANARNVGVEALDESCDFLLSLDTDDILPADWKWPDFNADVYSQKYPYKVMRLWRTKKGIKYVGRIHEVIHWDTSYKFQETDQKITHLQSDSREPERNIKLLKVEDASLRTLFYIGNEYSDLGQRDKAVVYYQHYINRCEFEGHWKEELMCAIWRCARHLERLGRVDESTNLALYGIKLDDRYAELWRQLAWNHREDNPNLAASFTAKADQCEMFPHLFGEDWAYKPTIAPTPKMEHIYTQPQFGENWFTYPKLYSKFVNNMKNGDVFVEVGSWKGKSTAYLGVEIANSGKDVFAYAVDHWKGSSEHQNDPLVQNDDLYKLFLANMSTIKTVTPIRGESVEIAEALPDDHIDIVFIDASHEYECVKQDIAAWLPKVKSGGILAGHDWNWPSVRKAVEEMLPSAKDAGEFCWIFKKP